MEGIKTFVLHTDEVEATLAELTDAKAGKLFKIIVQYAKTGITPELKGTDKLAFDPIKRVIDFNAKKYAKTVERRSAAGKKGAEARWHGDDNTAKEWQNDSKNSKRIFANSKNSLTVSDTDTVSESVSVYPTDIDNDAVALDGRQQKITPEQKQKNLEAIRERVRKAGETYGGQ